MNSSFDDVVTRIGRVAHAQMSHESVLDVSEGLGPAASYRHGYLKDPFFAYVCSSCGVRGHISRYRDMKKTYNMGNEQSGSPKRRCGSQKLVSTVNQRDDGEGEGAIANGLSYGKY